MKTLGDELPRETARVRALLPLYRSIGPSGLFALTMMERALNRADEAMISGDLPEMIAAYQDLKGFNS